ncbi:MAG: hypothetical protein HC795_03420 [Coleofasciculaceae cyanobacterium RL_1_1]|nr:hypothetical protein [Coleofasciculaceae cyanobacterium RL_1_1]
MASHPNPQSERKPTPAYVRVLRSYLRNVSSPTVWAPMAIIALLLALSADYWNSLRILEEDGEASLISENTSQLANSFSEASSIAASEIDSSDVLSSLLAQAELPVMADDNSVEQAKEQNQRLNLEEVDLLELPDLNKSAGGNSDDRASNTNGSDANTVTPGRRFGLMDLLSGNTTTGTTSSASPTDGGAVGFMGLLGARTSAQSTAGTTGTTGITGGVTPTSSVSSFNRSPQGTTLLNTSETEPQASLTQINSSGTFTGYPYPNVTVPNTTGFSSAPTFTGYPSSAGANVPATTPYTGGYTGYPTSPYVAPNVGSPYAPNSYGTSPYGNIQYGTQPNLNTTTGINTAQPTNVSPQNGYAIGVPNGAQVEAPAAPYSVPRSAPGRYIGNGEINTFANP